MKYACDSFSRHRRVSLWLIFISSTLFGQDLVPNGDLEGKNGKTTSRPWSFVNTIDYFVYTEAAATSENPVDKNQSLRKPHSGKAYLGMRIWGAYREYVQVKLTEPLKPGKKYSFKMYVAVSPYCNSLANELGAAFTKGAIALSDYTVINKTKPQVSFALKHSTKDSTDWFLLAGTFTAKGGERFLSLGHFTDRFKTHFIKKKALKPAGRKEAYYYFDDISLHELDDAGNEVVPKPKLIVKKTPADTTKVEENYLKKEAEKNKTIVMKNIYFASAKAELLPESFEELGLLVDLLNEDLKMEIEVTGHTDNTGVEKENKILSEKRAEAVVNYLINNGIKKERLSFSGKGSDMPIAPNDTEEGKQQNRRVEFVIKK